MPCGGIFPTGPIADGRGGTIDDENLSPGLGGCWVCNRGGCRHYCTEWDTMLHARCALEFLTESEEGEIVIAHGHSVILDFSLEKQKS